MRRLWILMLTLTLLSTGCGYMEEEDSPPEGALAFYYAVSTATSGEDTAPNSSAIQAEYHQIEEEWTVDLIFQSLMEGPASEELSSPFPTRLSLKSWSWEEGTLVLNLSESYGGLSAIGLTIADYCIVMTYCQLSNVDGVELLVEGVSLSYHNRDVMTPEDLLVIS